MIRKTKRKIRSAMRGSAARRTKARPRFDLREALRREVQAAHRRVDRMHERAAKLHTSYEKDHNVRWLEAVRRLDLETAIEAYRHASKRAALINRLFNLAHKYRKPETLEAHVQAFVRKQVAGRPLDARAKSACATLSRALFRYIYVETDKTADERLRRAWKGLGRALGGRRHPDAFLFELPERNESGRSTDRAAKSGKASRKR